MPQLPQMPSIRFEPELDCSPYELFRRLREGTAPALVDLRDDPALTLRGASTSSTGELAGWHPDDRRGEVVLLDDDGSRARETAAALRERGVPGVRALFGGLRLYDHALDPRVVGQERYLAAMPSP